MPARLRLVDLVGSGLQTGGQNRHTGAAPSIRRWGIVCKRTLVSAGSGWGRPRRQLRWPGAPQDSTAHWHVGEFQVRIHAAKHETPTAHVAPTYELRREKKLLRKGREQHICVFACGDAA